MSLPYRRLHKNCNDCGIYIIQRNGGGGGGGGVGNYEKYISNLLHK